MQISKISITNLALESGTDRHQPARPATSYKKLYLTFFTL
jgi:hypothetical protein